MSLWRVEVAGVSQRFVEAENRDEALLLVAAAVLDSLDLRVTAASPVIAQVYGELTPAQRRRMVAGLDGLISPAGSTSARRARRRLARQIRYDMATREWTQKHLASAPPIDPEVLVRLLSGSEVDHVKRLRQHLDELGVFE